MSEQTHSIFADRTGPIMALTTRKVFTVRNSPNSPDLLTAQFHP